MSLITKTTNDIMLNGINIFAKSLNTTPENVQILVVLDSEKKLKYYKCLNGEPIEAVSFLKILGKPLDILRYENLATPFLTDSVVKYAEIAKVKYNEIFIYISKGEHKQLWLGIYTKENKIDNVTLEDHFKFMGIK